VLTATDAGYLTSSGSAAWVRKDGSFTDGLPLPVDLNGGYGLERVGTGRTYRIREYATATTVAFELPAGDTYAGMFEAHHVVTLRKTAGKWTLHLLEVPTGGGPLVDRPVTGELGDFGGGVYEQESDARGAAFSYGTSAQSGIAVATAVLDWGSAQVTRIPDASPGGVVEIPHLAGGRISLSTGDGLTSLYIVDRDHLDAPGTLVDGLGTVDDVQKARVLGDWVLTLDGPQGAVRARPVAGGATRDLLPAFAGTFTEAADGSLYINGGSDAEHWAVQHITLGADGAPAVEAADPLAPVSVYEEGGVAVDQGRLLLATRHVKVPDYDYTHPGPYLAGSTLSVGADGTLNATPQDNLGELGWLPAGADPSGGWFNYCSQECLRLAGDGEGSILWPGPDVVVPALTASGSFSVVRSSAYQQVRDGTKVLSDGPWQAASLWGDTLWTPGSKTGTISGQSLPSLKAVGTVSVGATCVPQDLQVVGRWVYWSCGPGGKAAVYDRTTKKLISVPSGYAELADGYLVSQDDAADKLLITYLPGAVPADRVGTGELGPLVDPMFAPADRRGLFWAVDRFGGAVAYTTDSGDVTAKWPQVTPAKLAVIATDAATSADLRTDGAYTGGWHLSKPAAGWKVSITSATGPVVRTFSGGRATGKISVTWDGTAADGTKARTRTYRWTLTAQAADRAGESVSATGTVAVWSTAERHDFGTDGIGDVVTMDTAGRLAIQPGDGKGGIDSAHKLLAGGWPASSYPIPYGDVTADGCNELLVRTAGGDLVSYYAPCGAAITPKTSHRTVGTGFGGFNVLTSPGDVTGDGRPDLVARDAAGGLRVYPADGEGEFGPPTTVATGQGKYPRMAGAGDLNGDGLGDLLAVDSSGTLWRLLANGKGGFAPRVKITTGFGAYNVLAVPGDLTGDGRPDLITRDTAGNLWRWNGTSSGTFTGRSRIATGWKGYLYLT
jgi:hypothetical protein